ncbi:MAG: PEP-CTERM sorting domain-containing protein [Phycisphaerae bacterium]|nr:PEP-CTERM sorting domain-containing protein [Phycisphaerae bacterium]
MFAKNWKCVVSLAVLALFLTAVQAQAVLVNVDLNAGRTLSGNNFTSWSPTFTGAAVVGTGTQTWNALNRLTNNANPQTGSLAGLLDSDGNPSAVTLSAFSIPNGDFRDSIPGAVYGVSPAPPATDNGYNLLMGDRAAGGGQASVTISGVPAGPWDLYVFGWAGCAWQVTDGASPTQRLGWTVAYDGSDAQMNASSMVDGTTYVHFSGTHVAGTDLLLFSDTDGAASNGYGQVRFAGFQLTVIPEPATLMLIAVGVPFLLKRRRNA